MPFSKVQFNVYVQKRLKEYVEEIVETTDVESNSDAIVLLLAYAKKHWSTEDWNRLYSGMKVFGDEGLEKV